MMPPQSSDGANLMRPNGKVVVVVAGYPILARGLDGPRSPRKRAVTILAADPAADYG
jgi:hypothetical protein